MDIVKTVNLITKINFVYLAKVLFICLFFSMGFIPSHAFEDCIVTADGKFNNVFHC